MSAVGRFLPRSLLHLPVRTIRLRLTIVYASLFLASGAGLLAITYGLVSNMENVLTATTPDGSSVSISKREGTGQLPATGGPQSFQSSLQRQGGGSKLSTQQPRLSPAELKTRAERDYALAKSQHDADMRRLVERSGIALALMAAASIGLGWIVAGRVLRPLRTLNERAREISATSLHKRLALAGPRDELTELAQTFDDLLGRLEASFQAQRQFVANASHELRTPLARARTLAEVALTDPGATIHSLRASHRRVIAAGEHQERLIEALLTLARSERGLDDREPFDLTAVTAAAVQARRPEAQRRGLLLHTTLEPAQTTGDSRLAERLVANLLDNALRYNAPDGRIDVVTKTRANRAALSVSNTGPSVTAHEVERIFEPFRRLGTDRTDHSDGIGLGLSIVKAIVAAHDASLTARARPEGGLHIEVDFPPASAIDTAAHDGTRKHAFATRRPWLKRRLKPAHYSTPLDV
jgi:signal transduction histidine kinase